MFGAEFEGWIGVDIKVQEQKSGEVSIFPQAHAWARGSRGSTASKNCNKGGTCSCEKPSSRLDMSWKTGILGLRVFWRDRVLQKGSILTPSCENHVPGLSLSPSGPGQVQGASTWASRSSPAISCQWTPRTWIFVLRPILRSWIMYIL